MTITNTSWTLLCRDLAHKRQLLDYATSCGVPVLDAPLGGRLPAYRDDDDLLLGYYCGSREGIMSFPGEVVDELTETNFRRLCDAYHKRVGTE